MKKLKRKDEEGAMGVGTLIIFIAMVLVSAVAASVLIDTANKLQQQAEKTGDQAIREVSTSFIVKGIFGYDASSGDESPNEIGNISLKVGLAAGAPAQNLNQTVIQITNDTSEENLVAAGDSSTSANGAHYSWNPIIEQQGNDNQYVEQGDLYNVTINMNKALGGPVGTQAEISIQIIPKHGTPTYEKVTTPPVMTSKIVDLT